MTDLATTIYYIQQRAPGFQPRIGLVLGSGLGKIANQIQAEAIIPYNDIPGFAKSNTIGHPGNLILGHLKNTPIACFQGRRHFYEGNGFDPIRMLIRSAKLLGCEELLLTNAVGSLDPNLLPGELTLISDHINLQPGNPLIGPNDDEFGPRFFPLNDAYDLGIRQRLHQLGQQLKIKLNDSIYISVTGPNFETPAEIRAFRMLGADVVGMSTVAEVLVARHCGLKTAVISLVTNLAAGLSPIPPTQEETLENAALAAKKLTQLISHYAEQLSHE